MELWKESQNDGSAAVQDKKAPSLGRGEGAAVTGRDYCISR